MRRLSARQLAGWQAYYSLEPFGDERADLRSARICQVLAEINRDKKRRSKPFTIQDFMPDFVSEDVDEHRRQDPDEMKKVLTALAKQ